MVDENIQQKTGIKEKLGQEEVYNLIESNEVSWQALIYDLINTEQLNPWDVNLAVLSNKYLEKIRELEEANFFLSSKVLLAASLLLRIKSDILLHHHIKNIDEILFGKKHETKSLEKIEIDEDELPLLHPKSPLPRYKKVSLEELMSSLNKAMKTESRRIEKTLDKKRIEKQAEINLPKHKTSVKDRIRKIYSRFLTMFKNKKGKISYSELTGNNKEEKKACFLPCLHLDTQHKLSLEQENHFSEIYLWLYNPHKNQQTKEGAENLIQDKKQELTGINNPVGNLELQ